MNEQEFQAILKRAQELEESESSAAEADFSEKGGIQEVRLD